MRPPPHRRTLCLALAAVALFPACSSSSTATHADHPTRDESDYVLALLRAGPGGTALTREKREEIMRGHLENIGRLSREGQLLVAGPFGTPNPDPALRGIFVFDGDDLEEVQALCASDPAVAAGVLAPELVPMRAASALRRAHALDLAAVEARPAGAAPSSDMRGYALIIAPEARAAERALDEITDEGRVLLLGRLGGKRKGQALVLLDATGPDEARALIGPALSKLGDPEIFPWHGSASLAQLHELAREP